MGEVRKERMVTCAEGALGKCTDNELLKCASVCLGSTTQHTSALHHSGVVVNQDASMHQTPTGIRDQCAKETLSRGPLVRQDSSMHQTPTGINIRWV